MSDAPKEVKGLITRLTCAVTLKNESAAEFYKEINAIRSGLHKIANRMDDKDKAHDIIMLSQHDKNLSLHALRTDSNETLTNCKLTPL